MWNVVVVVGLIVAPIVGALMAIPLILERLALLIEVLGK